MAADCGGTADTRAAIRLVTNSIVSPRRFINVVIMSGKRSKPTEPGAMRKPVVHVPQKIVSGGQTGVDRAGLELALAMGIEHGGWCPRGRLAEDGEVPGHYLLTETDSSDYKVRTRQNVVDSDATLILYEGQLSGGTSLTRRFAREHHRPCLCVRIGDKAAAEIAAWLNEVKPNMLNIAGPRDSSSPGIEARALDVLLSLYYV